MKAVGYIRVSTDEQAKDGISLDQQSESIRAYCQAKGWELIEIISDEKTGKNLTRPGIQRVLSLAQQKKIDAMVVLKLDRLTRSVRDLGNLVEIFEKYDVAFSSIRDSFDTSTASGKLILNVLGSIAQWEREMIAERTRDGLRYKKARLENYGPVPYGFELDGKKLVPNSKEMGVVEYIRKLRHKLQYSYRLIAERLNTEGFLTRLGRQWHPSSIQIVANNDIYHHLD